MPEVTLILGDKHEVIDLPIQEKHIERVFKLTNTYLRDPKTKKTLPLDSPNIDGGTYIIEGEDTKAISNYYRPLVLPDEYLAVRDPQSFSHEFINRCWLHSGRKSVLYVATRSCDQMLVVLKSVHGKSSIVEQRIHSFLNTIGPESHYVIPLLDSFSCGQSVLLVMPYLEQLTFKTFTKVHTLQLFMALEFIHAAGVTHCDIKPANLLLNPVSKQIQVIDFGVACYSKTVILKGTGTPRYMAPELTSGDSTGSACDLWSAGITLIEFLVEEAVETRDPRNCMQSLSKDITQLLLGLLEMEPGKRLTATNAKTMYFSIQ